MPKRIDSTRDRIEDVSEIGIFDFSPTQCFFPVGECAHLDRFAVTDGIDARKAYFLPLIAVLKSNFCVNIYDDPVTSGDKPLRFAADFGPGRERRARCA